MSEGRGGTRRGRPREIAGDRGRSRQIVRAAAGGAALGRLCNQVQSSAIKRNHAQSSAIKRTVAGGAALGLLCRRTSSGCRGWRRRAGGAPAPEMKTLGTARALSCGRGGVLWKGGVWKAWRQSGAARASATGRSWEII